MNRKASISACIAKCGEEFDNYYDCLIDCMDLLEYDNVEAYPRKGLEDKYCFRKCLKKCDCIECSCLDDCLIECLASP